MSAQERCVCVHGHFYQPPRENPWLESIEPQDSAAPFHDWNERITAECYDPNAASRIVDGEGRIERIVNNYSRISFNVGPTLLSWMEASAPEVYRAIVEADRESRDRFSGHGAAIAQVYNHMILPLANRRDKVTQVLWGIRDFQHRFGRRPEGMWLPETAADTASLEALAEQGIRFTILAPSQARRVRKRGGRTWRDVDGARIDPTRAYEARLPSGRRIALFFYDGPVSRAVAFEGLLTSGETLAGRLTGLFRDDRDWPQLVSIATDGETFGHHHRHGDMALAYALHLIETGQEARLTVFGEYLERHPPVDLVEIHEPSAWSCVHGVGRWSVDCGCHGGGRPGWNQAWRQPLRAALDWLRDELAGLYERRASELLKDPWRARDGYIDVVLDRSGPSREMFLHRHARRPLSEPERIEVFRLLEMQRHAMLMFTSCGWFFDELSGIETTQVIQYAARAVQLAREALRVDLEPPLLQRLALAKSNLPEHGDGARIYDKFVRPAMLDLPKVCAHYAISSLFEDHPAEARLHGYVARREDKVVMRAGAARLLVGRARITSIVTGEWARLRYGVLHFGDHTLQAGVRPDDDTEPAHQTLLRDAGGAFDRGDLPAVLRTLDEHFQGAAYNLTSLFRDEQRRVIDRILGSALTDAEAGLQVIYDRHATLLRFLADMNFTAPPALRATADFVVNATLDRALAQDEPDLERIDRLLAAAARERVTLDGAELGYTLSRTLRRMISRLREEPSNLALLRRLEATAGLVGRLPFEVDTRWVQNLYYGMLKEVQPIYRDSSDPQAVTWIGHVTALGDRLWVRAA
jgi:alpha-amylase/alpha-mannosidase (GH57 family)